MAQNVVLDSLLFKRGEERNRSQVIPRSGEPIFVTDTKELYVGDGVTPGGNLIGALRVNGEAADGEVALFDGSTGKRLRSISKDKLLDGYVTNTALETRLTVQLQVQVDSAKAADNSTLLNGRKDYVTTDLKTDSFREDDSQKLSSARAVYLLNQEVDTQLKLRDTAIAAKLDKSSVINSVSSTATTSPCSAAAVKQAYDLALGVQQLIPATQATAQSALTTATNAAQAAQSARSAPDLATERKRVITISPLAPSGTPDEGTLWVQV